MTTTREPTTAMAGAGNGEVKLLGTWSSPFVLRVRLALSLKGVSYEYAEEDLKSKSQLLLESNPVYTKVPVLIHDGKPVCESLVILQYIDEAFASVGPSLLPEDPHDRAIARFWASYIDGTFLKASGQASSGKTEEEKAEGKKQAAAAVVTLEGALKECSKGKPFFGGDSPGYVDVVLGGVLAWLHAGDEMKGVKTFDPATTPLLAVWAESFDALDAVEPSSSPGPTRHDRSVRFSIRNRELKETRAFHFAAALLFRLMPSWAGDWACGRALARPLRIPFP